MHRGGRGAAAPVGTDAQSQIVAGGTPANAKLAGVINGLGDSPPPAGSVTRSRATIVISIPSAPSAPTAAFTASPDIVPAGPVHEQARIPARRRPDAMRLDRVAAARATANHAHHRTRPPSRMRWPGTLRVLGAAARDLLSVARSPLLPHSLAWRRSGHAFAAVNRVGALGVLLPGTICAVISRRPGSLPRSGCEELGHRAGAGSGKE